MKRNQLPISISITIYLATVSFSPALAQQPQRAGVESSGSDAVVSSYNEGMRAFVRGNYKEAMEKFENAVDKNPNNPAAYYYLALTCQKLGKHKEALGYYDFVVQHFATSKAYPLALKGAQQLAHLKTVEPKPLVPSTPENAVVLNKKEPASSPHPTPHVTLHGAQRTEPPLEFMPHEEKIPYTRYGDQIFVQGYVNGTAIKMELDGRHPYSVFGKHHLQQLGLKVPTGKPTKECPGVSAEPVPGWEADVPVALGKYRVNLHVDVVERLHAPILGQTFLSKMPHIIDHPLMNYITFTHTNTPAPKILRNDERPTFDLPFKVTSGRVVEALVNGRQIEMNFDIDTPTCVFSRADVQTYNLRPAREALLNEVGLRWVPELYYEIPSLQIGPIQMQNVIAKICPIFLEGQRPIIGRTFTEKLKFDIDEEKKIIHFHLKRSEKP